MPDENSIRSSLGFCKAIPKDETRLQFINALVDFGCTYEEFVKTFAESSILPKSNAIAQSPSNVQATTSSGASSLKIKTPPIGKRVLSLSSQNLFTKSKLPKIDNSKNKTNNEESE